MKNLLILFLLLLSVCSFNSCEKLSDVAEELSTEEVVEGLKTALIVGTDSSTTILSAANGYYGNPLLKIPLPDEAEKVRDIIKNTSALNAIFNDILNLDDEFEKVVKSINKAAESAAKDAAPIFKSAVNDLSITDAWDILNGINPADTSETKGAVFDSMAATNYFRVKTIVALVELFAPKINDALGKPLVENVSATTAWNTATSLYNDGIDQINSSPFTFTNDLDEKYNLPPSISTDLGVFCTDKALNGLFTKVGETERNIRRDPMKWIETAVGDILNKVFGKK